MKAVAQCSMGIAGRKAGGVAGTAAMVPVEPGAEAERRLARADEVCLVASVDVA